MRRDIHGAYSSASLTGKQKISKQSRNVLKALSNISAPHLLPRVNNHLHNELSSTIRMAPSQRSPGFKEAHAQLQRELAIIGDEGSRLELAKAYHKAQIAEERKTQRDRIKAKLEEEKEKRKQKQAEIVKLLQGETGESSKLVDLTSDDDDEVDD